MGENCGPMRATALRIRFWLFNAAKAQQPSWPGIKKRDANRRRRTFPIEFTITRQTSRVAHYRTHNAPRRSAVRSLITETLLMTGRTGNIGNNQCTARVFPLRCFSSNRIHVVSFNLFVKKMWPYLWYFFAELKKIWHEKIWRLK